MSGFEYNSVLLAAGAAGVALCFTLATSWLQHRTSRFLLTWAIAIAVVIVAIGGFFVFQATGEGVYAAIAGVTLVVGFALNYGGISQFRDGRFEGRTVAALALGAGLPIAVAGALGFDGLSFVLTNFTSAVVLGFSGYHFWRLRAESPVPIGAIAMLHFMLSVSYFLCAAVVFMETPLHFHGVPPSNWAEVVNLVCSVIAITGIGGLFITIHQQRISRAHRDASLTDPLTGLHNRRALFERFPHGAVPAGTGLILFDLDDFKGLNDRFGHDFGDKVLADFGGLLVEMTRDGDMAVRMGGEEFALVLAESSPTHALALAERVRGTMGRMAHQRGEDIVTCTLSAGVAIAEAEEASLDTLIRKADDALYLAKRSGRNRVSSIASSAA